MRIDLQRRLMSVFLFQSVAIQAITLDVMDDGTYLRLLRYLECLDYLKCLHLVFHLLNGSQALSDVRHPQSLTI